jgi:hypothetical protein
MGEHGIDAGLAGKARLRYRRGHCQPPLSRTFEAMELSADSGLTLTAYTAEPDTSSADGLKLLAGWAATQDTQAVDRP